MSDTVTPAIDYKAVMKAGQKWKPTGEHTSKKTYTVEEVRDQGAVLKREDRNDRPAFTWDNLKRAEFVLVQDMKQHEFTDRYCSVKVLGEVRMACVACGAVDGVNAKDTLPCTPNPGWREEADEYLLLQDGFMYADRPELFPEVKVKRRHSGFRQCNPLRFGGVFSLRDEDHERRR